MGNNKSKIKKQLTLPAFGKIISFEKKKNSFKNEFKGIKRFDRYSDSETESENENFKIDNGSTNNNETQKIKSNIKNSNLENQTQNTKTNPQPLKKLRFSEIGKLEENETQIESSTTEIFQNWSFDSFVCSTNSFSNNLTFFGEKYNPEFRDRYAHVMAIDLYTLQIVSIPFLFYFYSKII